MKKIGVIVPEKANDYGWNQQHAEAGKKMAEKIGAEYALADGAGYGDPAPVMRQLVQDGCDWILAGASGYMTVAKQVAQESKVKFNVIFSQENVPDNIQDIQTYAEQGAYLAGVLAAKTSKTGTVGIIVSADDENWTKMSAGFILAAKATKPDIKIKLAQVGQAAYADAPAAKRTTETVIAEGADVIFGMGDGSSFGMIQACETATPPSGADKVWFIDVIGDKTSLDTKGIYLSSVVWDYLPAWEEAYADMQAGKFGTETIWLELKNNGIGIIKTQWIPDDLWAEIEAIKQQIIDGTVKVPAIDKMDEVQKLLQ
ncbi:MAG: hypothetical protein A2W26_10950 [Acidobacteria bacterium RBG_16_64_8]|nr:MAG: hypothetical protein A2W26_10950 [Acidobacteria bacterium RBG_16_64_8]